MDTKAYVDSLLALNSEYISETEVSKAIVTFAFGLAEEYFEFFNASTPEDDIAELGDVLAYYVLLSHRCGKDSLYIVETLEYANKSKSLSYDCVSTTVWSMADYLGGFKRFVREDVLPSQNVIDSVLFEALNLSSDSIFDEAKAFNISKLRDRKQRNVLYSGSGDKR